MNNFIHQKHSLGSLLQVRIYRYCKRRDKILKRSLKIKNLETTSMLIKMLTILWVKILSNPKKNKRKKRK